MTQSKIISNAIKVFERNTSEVTERETYMIFNDILPVGCGQAAYVIGDPFEFLKYSLVIESLKQKRKQIITNIKKETKCQKNVDNSILDKLYDELDSVTDAISSFF